MSDYQGIQQACSLGAWLEHTPPVTVSVWVGERLTISAVTDLDGGTLIYHVRRLGAYAPVPRGFSVDALSTWLAIRGYALSSEGVLFT